MTIDQTDGKPDPDRAEPIGAPVVRGDPEITGAHAQSALEFDPDDPDSLSEAANVVREFVRDRDHAGDQFYILQGAAACAAVVRGTGSYKRAVEFIGDEVSVVFLRKWGRVHDLPISIRRHIARGDIPLSAATQIARVSGDVRFILAWTVLDHDLTADDVRIIASEILDGSDIETELTKRNITPGQITITVPLDTYREIRRMASLNNIGLDEQCSRIFKARIEMLDK